jgi:hypothetical protein
MQTPKNYKKDLENLANELIKELEKLKAPNA